MVDPKVPMGMSRARVRATEGSGQLKALVSICKRELVEAAYEVTGGSHPITAGVLLVFAE